MTDELLCPQCEKGHLAASTWADDFRHGDRAVHVDGLECYVCDQCGADPVFTDQIRRNQLKIADAKRRADGLLTGAEVRHAREHLGLTQQEAASLFGGGTNAFSKYERGDVLQSTAMDRLLRAALFYPDLIDFLRVEARIAAGEDERLDVQQYQAGPALNMRDKAYRSRSVGGQVVELNEPRQHWTRAA